MMERYSNTERLGVIETDRIVTKFLGWIFREQPIIDVGLDAFIEESENGQPKGRFIAVQIKTGIGNFHFTDKYLTYYVSHIHYNYWLNLQLPIILVAHIPGNEKTYWQEINEVNFKKTKKRWKIVIPKSQELNKKSKKNLEQILSKKHDRNFVLDLFKGKIEPNGLFDATENIGCIQDSVISMLTLADELHKLKAKTDIFNSKLNQFIDSGLSDKAPQVKASIKGFGKDINLCSKRLENEIELFSKLFSEGFFAYEQVIHFHCLFTKDQHNLEQALATISTIPDGVDTAIEGIKSMRDAVHKLPNNYAVLKEARLTFLQVIDVIIEELIQSKMMANGIKERILVNIQLLT